MIFVVDYHIIRAVHDLSVHPYHEFYVGGLDDSVGVTVITCSPDVPSVWSNPVGVIIVDHN